MYTGDKTNNGIYLTVICKEFGERNTNCPCFYHIY